MSNFYTRNDYLLNHPTNKTFEEILKMTIPEFRTWCSDLRKAVIYAWDVLGTPPVVGYTEEEILEDFNNMINFPVHEIECLDELTGKKDVFRNTNRTGLSVNSWFPTMMKTKINYTLDSSKGKSIYDFFSRDDLLERFITYSFRHFKKDSFYHYSNPVKVSDKENIENYPCSKTGPEWIENFESNYRKRGQYDYWLAPKEKEEYSGYNESLKARKNIFISKDEIKQLNIPILSKSNMTDKCDNYQIRVYAFGQKLFPIGFKAFRISYCQYATNWPPLVAKLMYERYTEQYKSEKNIYVWDPSCGWGGRLLGALATKDDRHITYLGCDPNTDHSLSDGKTKYDDIGEYFNTNTYRATGLFPNINEYKIWQLGSEVLQYNPEFMKYKGKLSFVMTSPPYFNREAYSQDSKQSFKQFSNYLLWKYEFLKETLKTAYDWLRPGGHIAWNIADLKIGKTFLPLEADSCRFMTDLGFKYITTWKLAMSGMPGANRTTEDGQGTAKNFCKSNGLVLKFEPIFIFKKPN